MRWSHYNSGMQFARTSRLVEINREFYQQFAASFDETRRRIQPGVAELIEDIATGTNILDLGCGNGELQESLYAQGFRGSYTGLDFSRELVALATSRIPAGASAAFHVADLSDPGWSKGLHGGYDLVLAFAVFHHLPEPIPEQIFNVVHGLLAPGGRFIFSNWQFLNSPRWRERIQPWELAGLQKTDVGPDDYLLDWRHGGVGFRYVHHYSEAELAELADKTGFKTVDSFYSDGKEGNLALYQVWQSASQRVSESTE